MSSTSYPDIPTLERPGFFDGQRLTAGDLMAVQDFHRELRWLHNRSLHTWGIAFGLAVSGQKTDRQVTIQPGCALDSYGRDLILTQAQILPVPVVAAAPNGAAATYYLTASYIEDSDLPSSETRSGVCQGRGAVRLPETLRLRWQNPQDTEPESRYRHGLDVVLATVQVRNCQLASPVSMAKRRDARPVQQPYVAAGATPEGLTTWTYWPDATEKLGVEATVDTSAAGFAAAPQYLAHVAGSRVIREPSGGIPMAANGQIVDGFINIVNPGSTGFVLRIILPRNRAAGSYTLNPDEIFQDNLLEHLQKDLNWHVVWIGIEG